MYSNSRNFLIRLVFDFCLFCTAIASFFLLHKNERIPSRGFFCSDDSIKYPIKKSLVPTAKLLKIVLFFPPILIILTASMKRHVCKTVKNNSKFTKHWIPKWIQHIALYLELYFVGLIFKDLIVTIAKVTVKRHRPHFITMCQPIMTDGTNCSNPINQNRYIEDYTCGNTNLTEYQLTNLSASFPSGHASWIFYAMIFSVLYVEKHLTWDWTRLLKPIMQILMIASSWYIGLSRVADFNHHYSDVFTGIVIGTSVACFMHSITMNKETPQIRSEATSTETILSDCLPDKRGLMDQNIV